MEAGKLRHYITIQQDTPTQNTYGEPVASWGTYKQVWASIEPISGREYFSAQQVQSEVTHRIRIRYMAGVTTKHRITYGSRVFDIESVINVVERDREIILMCVERTDG